MLKCKFKIGYKGDKGFWQCPKYSLFTKFCDQHRCVAKNFSIDGGQYNCYKKIMNSDVRHCSQHNCKIPTCDKIQNPSSRIRNAKYCQDHLCAIDGCSSKKLKDASSCSLHSSCAICYRQKSGNSNFCVEHSCSSKECNNVVTKTKGFCEYHQ